MDKKSKIFFEVFFALIAIVVTVTFSKYFILKDYYVEAEASCDPTKETCFVTTCDPESDSECPSDPEEQTNYTKLIKKKAYDIPLCDPNDENCDALTCYSGQDCEETLCDDSTVGEGQECNDPEKYNEENPAEEEETCAPDDETCPASSDSNASGDEEGSEGESAFILPNLVG